MGVVSENPEPEAIVFDDLPEEVQESLERAFQDAREGRFVKHRMRSHEEEE